MRRGQVKAHLKGSGHVLPKAIINQVSEAVQGWNGISKEAEEGNLPKEFDDKIPGLHLYPGLLCRREEECDYVCRKENSMKQHWSTKHAWSLQEKSGGRSSKAKEDNKAKFDRFTSRVYCHQVFTSQGGKHFIRVINQEAEAVANFLDVPKNKMDEFMSETMSLWKGKSKEIGEVMETDDKYLVNPWLRRTGWGSWLDSPGQTALDHMVVCRTRPPFQHLSLKSTSIPPLNSLTCIQGRSVRVPMVFWEA